MVQSTFQILDKLLKLYDICDEFAWFNDDDLDQFGKNMVF